MPNIKGGKEMAKQVREKAGLIAQTQAKYEKLMGEIRGYCQKAKDLRQQEDKLRHSSSTTPKYDRSK
ncbi:hypothetical protein C4A77_02600 [Brevibacillus laterosporus]|uniref:Uncharacterized protein n=2 Tax=Brevibacillus laterosporus TaxID=1465 RepID=A0AAP8QGI4_BRELA|nr:hypothetical protein C4A77_02600 [Brevibacillus laterosporus]